MPFRNNPAACALAKVPYVRAFSKIVDCLKGADLKSGSNCAVFKAAAAINSAGEQSVMLIRSIKMKKITTFILMCALFAGLTALAGCKNDNEDGPEVFLDKGGIFGTMQSPKEWDANDAKWTSMDAAAGVYEYDFIAKGDRTDWKVLVKKGDVEGGVYLGEKNNPWKIIDKAIPLNYAKKHSDGDNLYALGLKGGEKYRITVTVKGKVVSASIKKI